MTFKRAVSLVSLLAIVPCLCAAAPRCISVTGVSTPISAPGRYCLVRDIVSATGDGIVIRANNVSLDFAGHKLSTPVRTTPVGRLRVGIDVSNNHTTTIKNGTVQGFNIGIILGELVTAPNPGNYVVTNMKILDSASLGRAVGIFESTGSNVTIANNIISTVAGGNDIFGGDAFAIMVHGASQSSSPLGKIVIKGNQIDQVTSSAGGGDAVGILVEGGNETLVNGNVVTEIKAAPTSFQRSIGLNVVSINPEPGLVEVGENYVWNSAPSANSVGIRVNTNLTNVFIRDSTIGGFSTGMELGGSCVPFYLYNSIVGAVTPYSITGTLTPCGQGTSGPGNR